MKSVEEMPVRMIPKNINEPYRSSTRQSYLDYCRNLPRCDASPPPCWWRGEDEDREGWEPLPRRRPRPKAHESSRAAAASRKERAATAVGEYLHLWYGPYGHAVLSVASLGPWPSPVVPTRGCACGVHRNDGRRVLLVELATVTAASDTASGSTHRELPPMAPA